MFVSLQLTAEKKVDRRLLPPKKMLGKNSKSLVEKRQKELELYLQTLLRQFPQATPTPLACFLHFHLYVSTPEANATFNLRTCTATSSGATADSILLAHISVVIEYNVLLQPAGKLNVQKYVDT